MNRTDASHPNCFFLSVILDQTKDTLVASILTCTLNTVFSVLTSIGNFIILLVIWKKPEFHSPSFILLFCLAVSDLLVGVICQPTFVIYHIAELAEFFSVYCTFRITQTIAGYITAGTSVVTLSLVTVDRLLALTLHLRYNAIVTVKRTLITISVLWVLFTTGTVLRFWISEWNIIPSVLLLLTFLVTTLGTLKIFQIVRRHQRQISQQQQHFQTNLIRCRKSAVTVLYVYGLYVISYTPVWATKLVYLFTGYTIEVKIAYDYTGTAVFINSFLNPLVYCWRIKEIRRAVKNLLSIRY